MASIIASATAAALSSTAAAASPTGNRAPPQGGVLEGLNPSVYNPKDPIILFIIQVSNRQSQLVINMLDKPGLIPL